MEASSNPEFRQPRFKLACSYHKQSISFQLITKLLSRLPFILIKEVYSAILLPIKIFNLRQSRMRVLVCPSVCLVISSTLQDVSSQFQLSP